MKNFLTVFFILLISGSAYAQYNQSYFLFFGGGSYCTTSQGRSLYLIYQYDPSDIPSNLTFELYRTSNLSSPISVKNISAADMTYTFTLYFNNGAIGDSGSAEYGEGSYRVKLKRPGYADYWLPDTQVITKNQVAQAYANIGFNYTGGPICEGNLLSFTSNTNLNASHYYWNLYTPGELDETDTDQNFSTTKFKSTSILTLTIYGTLGSCMTGSSPVTTTFTKNMLPTSVLSIETPSVSILSDKPVICEGEQVTFFVENSNHGGLSPTYDWKVNNSTVQLGFYSSWSSAALQKNDVVSVEMTSRRNCVTSEKVTSNSIQREFIPTLTNFTLGGSLENLCPGINAPELQITSIYSQHGDGYQYDFDNIHWYRKSDVITNGNVVETSNDSDLNTIYVAPSGYNQYYEGDQLYAEWKNPSCTYSVKTNTLEATMREIPEPIVDLDMLNHPICTDEDWVMNGTYENMSIRPGSEYWISGGNIIGVGSSFTFTPEQREMLLVDNRIEFQVSGTKWCESTYKQYSSVINLDDVFEPVKGIPPLDINHFSCVGEEVVIEPVKVAGQRIIFFDANDQEISDGYTNTLELDLLPSDEDYTYKYKYLPFELCSRYSDDFGIITVDRDVYCDKRFNYTTVKSFSAELDESGEQKIASAQRVYFDQAGKTLQSQVYQPEEGLVMANEPLYDEYQRAVGNSLMAPITTASGEWDMDGFGYKLKLITEEFSQEKYAPTHFDGARKNSPAGVDATTPGTLGWYYSANNTLEDNVPQTTHPYTRTDFYEDGSGEVKRSAGPGNKLHMGNGHESISKTLPVGNQGVELANYNALRKVVLNLDEVGELERVYKQVSIDPDKKEVVSYQSEAGTIATAIVKDGNKQIVYTAKEGQIEIHVPERGTAKTRISLTHKSNETFKVLDKINDEADENLNGTPANVDLEGGIYTIQGVSEVEYAPGYAEYSYNIYDNAGRLAASIAPLGIEKMDILNESQAVVAAMSREDLLYTTFYTYDYQGRLIEMDEPDAGVTKYLYRKDGSIRFSENEEQRGNSYSYTCYDASGRPVESGEYLGGATFSSRNTPLILESKGRTGWSDADRKDWVETYYDLAYENQDEESLSDELAAYMKSWFDSNYSPGYIHLIDGVQMSNEVAGQHYAEHYQQDFLEGAVSYTKNDKVTTWYSYDEFGQVTFIVMFYKNMNGGQYFTIDYQYDYFGNVIEVAYQKYFLGESFYHHYEYNKNQQLTKVYTSQAGQNDPGKYLHATYHYYLHGPLKRIELAENLQGLDYTYTIQGWLKAINNPDNINDPGEDGSNEFFHDAFGMEIDYFDGDYNPTAVDNPNDQYGGNIRGITWGREGSKESIKQEVVETVMVDHLEESLDAPLTADAIVEAQDRIEFLPGFDSNGYGLTAQLNSTAQVESEVVTEVLPMAIDAQEYAYTYDFKNQLKEAVYTASTADASAYKVTGADNGITYDANGNIQSLMRHDETAALVDDFTYDYNYEANTNQLEKVDDAVDNSVYSSYQYNAIGQMTAALGRGDYGDQYFAYDVTGKVTGIYSDEAHNDELVAYTYDDRGFRIAKKLADGSETWYVRDASGNIIAIYEGTTTDLQMSEAPIYGSGKIGTSFRDIQKHKYNYELTDHLGNVRAVVSKLKFYETATMENHNNIDVHEETFFANLDNIRHTSDAYDNSFNGNKVAFLDGKDNKIMGPALSRAVNKGETIQVSVFANYLPESPENTWGVHGLEQAALAILAGSMNVATGGEAATLNPDYVSDFSNAMAGAMALPVEEDNVPMAYLQCLVFDEHFELVSDASLNDKITSEAAGLDGSSPDTLSIKVPIEQDGYVYIYVVNETPDAKVFFDEMRVSHLGFEISEMTDYYPFGSIAMHWQAESTKDYRFGYQGQFAEEDSVTGFNHFEARDYDAVIGRWMNVDPMRYGYSPYIGMANNPIATVDRDGRVPHVVIAAAIGGVIGGGVSIYKNWDALNSSNDAIRNAALLQVALDTGEGAAVGALTSVGATALAPVLGTVTTVEGVTSTVTSSSALFTMGMTTGTGVNMAKQGIEYSVGLRDNFSAGDALSAGLSNGLGASLPGVLRGKQDFQGAIEALDELKDAGITTFMNEGFNFGFDYFGDVPARQSATIHVGSVMNIHEYNASQK